MKIRHWVLIAPFGPNDFTIYEDRRERDAVADYNRRREAGEQVSFVTTSGSLADVRITLKAKRAEYVAQLADETRKVGC